MHQPVLAKLLDFCSQKGIFYFGENKKQRVFIEQQACLQAICIHKQHAAAIDREGRLLQWTSAGETKEHTFSGSKLCQLACNKNAVACLSEDGQIFLLDADGSGAARSVSMPEPAQKICLGEDHLLALSVNGCLYSGPLTSNGNAYGQLGSDENAFQLARIFPYKEYTWLEEENKREYFDYWAPKIEMPPALPLSQLCLQKVDFEKQIVDIACGDAHSIALDCDGDAYAFGLNDCLVCCAGC